MNLTCTGVTGRNPRGDQRDQEEDDDGHIQQQRTPSKETFQCRAWEPCKIRKFPGSIDGAGEDSFKAPLSFFT